MIQNSLAQQIAQLVRSLFEGTMGRLARELEIPILPLAHPSVLDGERVPWQQAPHTLEERLLAGEVVVSEKSPDRTRVNIARHLGISQQRLNLRSEP